MKPNYLLDYNGKPFFIECEFSADKFFNKHRNKIIKHYKKYSKEWIEKDIYNVPYFEAHDELGPQLTKTLNSIFYTDGKSPYKIEARVYVQTPKKQYTIMHCHGNNDIPPKFCSVLYTNLPKEGGGFGFMYNDEEVQINIKENTLYFFHSSVPHRPLPHTGKETRVCLNIDWFTDSNSMFKEFDHYW